MKSLFFESAYLYRKRSILYGNYRNEHLVLFNQPAELFLPLLPAERQKGTPFSAIISACYTHKFSLTSLCAYCKT